MFYVSDRMAYGVSGYFFFNNLINRLSKSPNFNKNARTILVNVSIPILELVKLKLKRKFIVLRLDGAYHDRIDHTDPKRNPFWFTLCKYYSDSTILNWLYNFFNENWKVELRLAFSDAIVYQSNFSLLSHKKFIFGKIKPSTVISNACPDDINEPLPSTCIRNKLLVVLGAHKRKNDYTAIAYAIRLCKERGLKLKIVNWDKSRHPNLVQKIEHGKKGGYVEVCTGYKSLSELEFLARDCLIFVFLSYRDPCPNILLETLSLGLLPLALSSGGIPEMLPKHYPLINFVDTYGHFSPARYSSKIPYIDYGEFLVTYEKIQKFNIDQVRTDKLLIGNVAKRYETFLMRLADD